MLFNTLQFAFFFIIVYGLYLFFPHRTQNRMLLVASYIFYGSWNAIFLTLIFISTILDYICGRQIYSAKKVKHRQFFLTLSIAGNLTILGFFKYFNFFAENLQQLLNLFGQTMEMSHLHIVLPIGISFYTFQTMSYTIDIYRRQLKPVDHIVDFALYVAFFPQLVAGPIERATRLLPQITTPRRLSLTKIYEGGYLIFWGLFLKVFVADNLAKIVDPVFAAAGPYQGTDVLIAVYAFTIQIYCDFAGYSHIARGLGKCMGFDIMLNFNLPYFATNPRELWQRWHISLSTWIRDYLFQSLGGYTKGMILALRNIIFAFALGGLWHGANWTFIFWGIYHGLLLVVYVLIRPYLALIGEPKDLKLRGAWFAIRVIGFFHLFCLGALIFRATTVMQAWEMLQALALNFHSRENSFFYQSKEFLFYTWILFFVEWVQYRAHNLNIVLTWPVALRAAFYVLCFYLLLIFGVQGGEQFYYFQF